MLGGSLAPDDAPPGYVEVATLLQAARGAGRGPAEVDGAFQDRLLEAVTSAGGDARRPSRWWSPSRRRAAVSALVVAAATTSLATADVNTHMPFGDLPGVPGREAGSAPPGPGPADDRTVDARDARAEVFVFPDRAWATDAAAATVTAPAPGAPLPGAGGHVRAPPPATPATLAGGVPPGQARRSSGARPGQVGPPAHARGNANSGNRNGGNGKASRPPAAKAPPPRAENGPGRGNAYGRDGQQGPPAGRAPTGRGHRG